jgi:hypothetical protein
MKEDSGEGKENERECKMYLVTMWSCNMEFENPDSIGFFEEEAVVD